jgi:hypothetical protein
MILRVSLYFCVPLYNASGADQNVPRISKNCEESLPACEFRTPWVPRVELARKQLERVNSELQLGTAQRVDSAEATLRLQELETEMAKAELDLALARRELQQRRSSR